MQGGGATNFMDRAIINCAHALEEAWAWGFDVDVWRAHLNAQTWPEVSKFSRLSNTTIDSTVHNSQDTAEWAGPLLKFRSSALCNRELAFAACAGHLLSILLM